jgi:glutathione peroxidase
MADGLRIGRRAALAGAVAMTAAGAVEAADPAATIFAFRLESLDGGPLDLGQFRGRPMLVVNTASFCGYTPQYRGLEALHRRLSPRGLVVLGAPSNDFNQESSDPNAIKQFCESTYEVQFPMTMPMRVRGPEAHPLFAFLAARGGGAPRWNFHKYLVARDGRTVQGFATRVAPDAPDLTRAIDAVLAAPAGA